MTSFRRRALLLGAGATVLLLVVALAEREPAPEVPAARARRENLSASISSNGKVEPITPHVRRAQFPTFVQRVFVVEGRSVRAGEVLVELDAAATHAALARARQEMLTAEDDLRAARAGGRPDEVAQLESDLRKAEAELARQRAEREGLARLFDKQAATRDEVALNRLALERAEAQWRLLQQRKDDLARRARLDQERAALAVERARNDVRDLAEKAGSARVTAPADGTVYQLPVRVGDFVQTGDLLAAVADLQRVRVRAFVDEPEMGLLEQGQAVEITWDAMPGRVWIGRTEQVPKAVVARGTRSVGEVLCSVENEKLELLPNTNVNVRIRVRERADALVVPRAAVRADGSHRFVFVIEGNRLRRRNVRLGIAGATMHEILEGLTEGERVALPGAVELTEGLAARIVDQP